MAAVNTGPKITRRREDDLCFRLTCSAEVAVARTRQRCLLQPWRRMWHEDDVPYFSKIDAGFAELGGFDCSFTNEADLGSLVEVILRQLLLSSTER